MSGHSASSVGVAGTGRHEGRDGTAWTDSSRVKTIVVPGARVSHFLAWLSHRPSRYIYSARRKRSFDGQ